MTNVQALYVDPKGIYPKLLGRENCWDEKRDAREYDGEDPVIVHPPCQLWTNFAAVNYKRYPKEKNRPGNDGNCFKCALVDLLYCGGVLEHPAGSKAFAAHNLPKPQPGSWQYVRSVGNGRSLWITEVRQACYGHRCRKCTWLVYVGLSVPFDLDWRALDGTHQIGWFDRKKPTVSKREASATPEAFAKLLIDLARWSRDGNA